MNNSDTRKLERELLLNEKKVEKLVEKMGDIGLKLRSNPSDKEKKALETKMKKLQREKEELEGSSEDIVLQLCEVGDDEGDGEWPFESEEDEDNWMHLGEDDEII